MNKYLRFSRYILGICSLLSCILGSIFILFMPPLWFICPLFFYLIFLNFHQPSRALDQFDLIQICIWFIAFLPSNYFMIINFVFASFISYKLIKQQIIGCWLIIAFCIVFLITKDKNSIIILILLYIFAILYDLWLKHKRSRIL